MEEQKQQDDYQVSQLETQQSGLYIPLADTKPPRRYPLVPLDQCNDDFGRSSTCVDVLSPAGKVTIHNCISAPTYDSAEYLDNDIALVAWAAWDTEEEDEHSGEIKRYIRWALVAENGDIISGTGGEVLKALRLLCASEGPGPWEKPKVVQIFAKTTRAKRTVYLMRRIS